MVLAAFGTRSSPILGVFGVVFLALVDYSHFGLVHFFFSWLHRLFCRGSSDDEDNNNEDSEDSEDIEEDTSEAIASEPIASEPIASDANAIEVLSPSTTGGIHTSNDNRLVADITLLPTHYKGL